MADEPLTPWLIRLGYLQGVFPMADDDGEIGWYRPNRRCLFPIEGIHVSRSLRKLIERKRFSITFDHAFEEVVRSCRRPADNWISEEIVRAYTQVHHEGWAHSCEVWRGDELVGGTYGLALGACFCAESMFHRVSNASKLALWAMVERCRELGFTIFDAEVMNPHLASLGAFEVSNKEYMAMLAEAVRRSTPWGPAIRESSYF